MISIESLLKNNDKQFFSIEITPKESFTDVDLSEFPVKPLFVSTAWIGDENLKYESLKNSPVLRALKGLNDKGIPVLTHISCYKLNESHLDEVLSVTGNLFPLKGEAAHETQTFQNALELIKEIKSKKRDVTIFTSGYPKLFKTIEEEKHEMEFIQMKINAGANAIITQVVYEVEVFDNFVTTCRQYGIDVPIIPGIFVPVTFSGLKKMEELTRQKLPESLMTEYKMFSGNEQLFKEFAVETSVKIVNEILLNNKNHGVLGVHFFTMNNFEQVLRVVKQLDFN